MTSFAVIFPLPHKTANSVTPLLFRVTEDSPVSVVHLVLLDLLVPVVPLDLQETMVPR